MVLFADHPVSDALPIVAGEILTVLTFVVDYPLSINWVDSGNFRLLGDIAVDGGRGKGTCELDLTRRCVCWWEDAISSRRGYKG